MSFCDAATRLQMAQSGRAGQRRPRQLSGVKRTSRSGAPGGSPCPALTFRNLSLRECIEGETAKAIIAIETNSSPQMLGVSQHRSFRHSYDGRYNMHLCGVV